MKTKTVTITKDRPRAFSRDWLVRGIGKRAIHVAMRDDDHEQYRPTEHETYWLLNAVAQAANKRGWKNVWVAVNRWTNVVTIHNCTAMTQHFIPLRQTFVIGAFPLVAGSDHFLNDNHLTPQGFWIK